MAIEPQDTSFNWLSAIPWVLTAASIVSNLFMFSVSTKWRSSDRNYNDKKTEFDSKISSPIQNSIAEVEVIILQFRNILQNAYSVDSVKSNSESLMLELSQIREIMEVIAARADRIECSNHTDWASTLSGIFEVIIERDSQFQENGKTLKDAQVYVNFSVSTLQQLILAIESRIEKDMKLIRSC